MRTEKPTPLDGEDLKIEQVEWLDSCSSSHWHELGEDEPLSKCTTVGFVIQENKDSLSLASSLAHHEGQRDDCCLVMTIPKKVIASRRVMK